MPRVEEMRQEGMHEGIAQPAGSRLGEVSSTLTLLRALCRHPLPLRRLAELIGKHPRTARRYLEALGKLGAPIQSDLRRSGSRWVRVWWMRPGAAWAWLVAESAESLAGPASAAEKVELGA